MAPVLFTTSTTILNPAAAMAFTSTSLYFKIAAMCSSKVEWSEMQLPNFCTVAKLKASFS
jgi:hypothetical protein